MHARLHLNSLHLKEEAGTSDPEDHYKWRVNTEPCGISLGYSSLCLQENGVYNQQWKQQLLFLQ